MLVGNPSMVQDNCAQGSGRECAGASHACLLGWALRVQWASRRLMWASAQDHMIRDINAGRFAKNTSLVLVTHGLAARVFLMRWFHWTVDQVKDCC